MPIKPSELNWERDRRESDKNETQTDKTAIFFLISLYIYIYLYVFETFLNCFGNVNDYERNRQERQTARQKETDTFNQYLSSTTTTMIFLKRQNKWHLVYVTQNIPHTTKISKYIMFRDNVKVAKLYPKTSG